MLPSCCALGGGESSPVCGSRRLVQQHTRARSSCPSCVQAPLCCHRPRGLVLHRQQAHPWAHTPSSPPHTSGLHCTTPIAACPLAMCGGGRRCPPPSTHPSPTALPPPCPQTQVRAKKERERAERESARGMGAPPYQQQQQQQYQQEQQQPQQDQRCQQEQQQQRPQSCAPPVQQLHAAAWPPGVDLLVPHPPAGVAQGE